MNMTTDRIRALSTDAAEAGDLDQVRVCELALRGDRGALVECERVLAYAAAQDDDTEHPRLPRVARGDAQELES